jgi:hypothetical protein
VWMTNNFSFSSLKFFSSSRNFLGASRRGRGCFFLDFHWVVGQWSEMIVLLLLVLVLVLPFTPIHMTGCLPFSSNATISPRLWLVMKLASFLWSRIGPLFPTDLARPHEISTSQSSVMLIWRSSERKYSLGLFTLPFGGFVLALGLAFGFILMKYHHASWDLCCRRKLARIASIERKARFQTLPFNLLILFFCNHINV